VEREARQDEARKSSTWLDRLVGYLVVTLFACPVAAVVGETFFPAELIGDTGENDFAGLAAMVWGLAALLLCLVGSIASEVYLVYRRHRR
jgi:Na+/serine symporter